MICVSANPLGELVSNWRQEHRWSREDVAALAKKKGYQISASYVQKIEQGGVDPENISTGKYDALAAVTGIPSGELQAIAKGKTPAAVLAAVPGITTAATLPKPRRELAEFITRTRGSMAIHDLARIAGVPATLFDEIAAGHVPPPAILKKIAAALGVEFEAINAAARPGRPAPAPGAATNSSPFAILGPKVPVPYYGKVGCGDFLELHGQAIDRVGVPEGFLQEGDFDAMAVLVADGTSMNRAGIQHGMNLLVDTSLEPQPGDVVIATVPRFGTTCKRLESRPDGLYLVPESTDHHPTIKVDEEVRIDGVLVRAWADIEFRRKR